MAVAIFHLLMEWDATYVNEHSKNLAQHKREVGSFQYAQYRSKLANPSLGSKRLKCSQP